MNKISFFVLVLFFVSCNGTRNKSDSSLNLLGEPDDSTITLSLTESLKNPTDKFGVFVDTAYIVALQTTENKESMVGMVKEAIVTDKYIYIRDNYKTGSVIVFKSDGAFVKRIATGRGPGEINGAERISFNHYNNTLLVYYPYRINLYTADGSFIVAYDSPLISDIVPINDGYLIVQRDWQNSAQLNSVIKTDSTFAITENNHFFISGKIVTGFMPNFRYSSVYNNEPAHLFWPLHNVIYIFNNNNIKAKYLLEYPHVTNAQKYEEYKSRQGHGLYDYNGLYGETSDFLYLQFSDYEGIGYGVYINKRNNQSYAIQLPLYNIYGYGKFVGNYNDFFVRCIVSPSSEKKQEIIDNSLQWLSEESTKKIQHLNADNDNPLFVFYRLKDIANE